MICKKKKPPHIWLLEYKTEDGWVPTNNAEFTKRAAKATISGFVKWRKGQYRPRKYVRA